MINYKAVILGVLSGIAVHLITLMIFSSEVAPIGGAIVSAATISSYFTKHQSK